MCPNSTAYPCSVKDVSHSLLDCVELWRHWSRQLPSDRRARWSFVYLATREVGGQLRWKIGVSKHPWKRRREVNAKAIAFSRLVYLPYHLEMGLHNRFAEQRISPWEEWFLLEPKHVSDAMRIIDFWQLVSPHEQPADITRLHDPLTGQVELVTEFDSYDERFKPLRWA